MTRHLIGVAAATSFLLGDNDSKALLNLCHWISSKINYPTVMYTFSDYIWLWDQ